MFFKTCMHVFARYAFAFSKRKCVILFHLHWYYIVGIRQNRICFSKSAFVFNANMYPCFRNAKLGFFVTYIVALRQTWICFSTAAFVLMRNMHVRFENTNVWFSFTYTDTASVDFSKTRFVFKNPHLSFSEILICVFKTQMCDSLSLALILHR